MSCEQRVADLWAALDDHEPEAFRARVEALAAERPPGDAAALFERACANDTTGRPEEAAAVYPQALAAGLTGIRRRRAVIQHAALVLTSLGREREAVGIALGALAPHLPRYDRSMAASAEELTR